MASSSKDSGKENKVRISIENAWIISLYVSRELSTIFSRLSTSLQKVPNTKLTNLQPNKPHRDSETDPFSAPTRENLGYKVIKAFISHHPLNLPFSGSTPESGPNVIDPKHGTITLPLWFTTPTFNPDTEIWPRFQEPLQALTPTITASNLALKHVVPGSLHPGEIHLRYPTRDS
jgi:hypothetical protein